MKIRSLRLRTASVPSSPRVRRIQNMSWLHFQKSHLSACICCFASQRIVWPANVNWKVAFKLFESHGWTKPPFLLRNCVPQLLNVKNSAMAPVESSPQSRLHELSTIHKLLDSVTRRNVCLIIIRKNSGLLLIPSQWKASPQTSEKLFILPSNFASYTFHKKNPLASHDLSHAFIKRGMQSLFLLSL